MSEEKPKSLEEMVREIEELTDALSGDEVPLEEAFALYEEGVKKVRACQSAIETVEKKLRVLSEEAEEETADES